mmetsp:Transcript_26837/g.39463  ORF Transcript_26837/g.39463 Transcript_26837/m.39463 type:complete len:132 (+) Transcript_26837:225-620(+)
MFFVPFSLFPQDCPPPLGSMTPAKTIFPVKNKTCSKSRKDTERRGMVRDESGDDDLNVDQYQTEGQHNLQWMDTLIGLTSCAAGNGGNGQYPSLGALVSARPAEWELVNPPAQHNGAGSSSADTMRMNKVK